MSHGRSLTEGGGTISLEVTKSLKTEWKDDEGDDLVEVVGLCLILGLLLFPFEYFSSSSLLVYCCSAPFAALSSSVSVTGK